MNRIAMLIVTLAVSSSALAERNVSYAYGTVVESTPIVKTVRTSTPREECWEEEVAYRTDRQDNGIGTVVGAIVGGAIGNAVGHNKSNKKVGAVVGAVLGGTIGNAASQDHRSGPVRYENEEVCRVITEYEESERIVGYHVRYRYNNETYVTRMDSAPGDTIKLRLAVSPVI